MLSLDVRQEMKEWVLDCNKYGEETNNTLTHRALNIFKQALKEDEDQ